MKKYKTNIIKFTINLMINPKLLLFFDIETTTEFKNYQEFLSKEPDGAKSFKIKYDRAQKRKNKDWFGSIDDAYINNAPLLAEYGKIVCISFGYFNKDKFLITTKSIEDYNYKEEKLINYISNLFIKSSKINLYPCGHNIKGFDIPFLFKKMLKYKIKIPDIINSIGKKPWEINIIDSADLTKGTSFVASSLADVTYLLGLNSPKDDIDGSEVYNIYWEDKNIKRICDYCEKDVIAVKEIILRIKECIIKE